MKVDTPANAISESEIRRIRPAPRRATILPACQPIDQRGVLRHTPDECHAIFVSDEHAVELRYALQQLLEIALHGILRGDEEAENGNSSAAPAPAQQRKETPVST